MTRITDFGRKRTYLEAGLAHSEPKVDLPEDTPPIQEEATADASDPPPKKKRKRSKKKVEEGGEVVAVVAAGPSEPKKVKKKSDKHAKKDASESRRIRRISEREADTTCFACREKGHAARHCPKTKTQTGKRDVGICYRCGSNKHSLSRCRNPEDPKNPLPFASCFVCSGKGHLASACPENKSRGVYPNGGCCKLCGETSHLAKNCGLRKQDVAHNPSVYVVEAGAGVGADEDGFHAFKRTNSEIEKDEKRIVKAFNQRATLPIPPPKKVVNFL